MQMTPLHWAVEEDYPNLVELLLEYGANPYAQSKFGETPFEMAQQLGFNDIVEEMTQHQM